MTLWVQDMDTFSGRSPLLYTVVAPWEDLVRFCYSNEVMLTTESIDNSALSWETHISERLTGQKCFVKVSSSGTCLVIFLLGSCCPRMQETLTCSHSVQQKRCEFEAFSGVLLGGRLSPQWHVNGPMRRRKVSNTGRLPNGMHLPTPTSCFNELCVLDSYCVVELHPYLIANCASVIKIYTL